MIQVDVRPMTADVRNAKWAWYFRSRFGLGATALLVILLLMTTLQVIHGDMQAAKPSFGVIAFLLLLPIFIGFAGLKSPAVRRFTEGPVTYSFGDDGLNVRTQRAHADFRWSEIARAIETKRLFVLVAGGALQVLPMRDITPESQAAIRQLLRERLVGKA